MYRLALALLLAGSASAAQRETTQRNPVVQGTLDLASNSIVRVGEVRFTDGTVMTTASTQPVVVNITNNVTNTVSILSEFYSLRFQTRLQMDKLTAGQPVGSDWTAPVGFSGMSVTQESRTICLVTSRHGITCAHAGAWPGAEAVYRGTNAAYYTNHVQSTFNVSNDLQVVTFSNAFPESVQPFAILPTNILDWFEYGNWGVSNGQSYPLEVVWRDFSTGTAHWFIGAVPGWNPVLQGLYHEAGAFGLELPWPGQPIFRDDDPGTYYSGDPVFLIVNGQPCFLYAAFFPGPGGPLVSWQPHYEGLRAAIGTNGALSFPDLSRFTKYSNP